MVSEHSLYTGYLLKSTSFFLDKTLGAAPVLKGTFQLPNSSFIILCTKVLIGFV